MIRRVLLAALGLLGLGLLLAAPAAAHATVVSSTPADGSRLQAAPRTVSITFDEGVGLGGIGYVHVTDQTGRRLDARAAYHPAGHTDVVADDLRGGLGDGTYTVSFRVVSADSHPVAGTIRFVVGDGALAHGTVTGSATDATTSAVFDVVRWVSYAGVALLGGGWLLLTIWPAGRDERRARRLVWTGWGLTGLGAVLEVLLEGPYTAGTGLGGFGATVLDSTLHTDYGLLHCVRLILLGALAVVLARALQPGRIPAAAAPAAGLLGVGVLVTFSAAGHGASTSPNWVSVPLDVLHLAAMGAWLGGLVMLTVALLPRREPGELRAALPVFSTVAFTSVVVLAVSGTYAAWRGIGALDAIVGSTYGLLVLGKVALFVVLLAFGNLSRRAVRRRTVAFAMTTATLEQPAVETGVDVERLRRSVYVEAVVGVVVLALTAVLVAEPRGREALAADDREPVSASAPLTGGHHLTVTADPGTHGPVDVTVAADERLPAGTTITATATEPRRQLGPLPIRLTRRSDGSFDGRVSLPTAGSWDFDLVVTTSTFDATSTDVTLEIH